MIGGMSLIERVYRQCKKAQGIDMVVVATDSEEIAKHVNSFGAGAIMTPEDCPNGTMRVALAAKQLSDEFDIIINVQGDEPLVEPETIEKLVGAFKDDRVKIATPIAPIIDQADINNPNIVKVVVDVHGDILYFSRSLIPYSTDTPSITYSRHIGLYAFRRNILEELSQLQPTALEETERLEQLRWLYHGYRLRSITIRQSSVEVNTPEDIRKVEQILRDR
jgi:3-deoxy-manno-octulosonate cytidylyltransferase (CMP-KDO synthetase)